MTEDRQFIIDKPIPRDADGNELCVRCGGPWTAVVVHIPGEGHVCRKCEPRKHVPAEEP